MQRRQSVAVGPCRGEEWPRAPLVRWRRQRWPSFQKVVSVASIASSPHPVAGPSGAGPAFGARESRTSPAMLPRLHIQAKSRSLSISGRFMTRVAHFMRARAEPSSSKDSRCMRRTRKDATKVWHNPDIHTVTRRSGAGGPTGGGAPRRRRARRGSPPREAASPPRWRRSSRPKREPRSRRRQEPRTGRPPRPVGRIVLASPPQTDSRAAERQKLLNRLLVAEGRPRRLQGGRRVPRGGLHLPRRAGRLPPAPRARARGARAAPSIGSTPSSRGSCPSAAPGARIAPPPHRSSSPRMKKTREAAATCAVA